MVENFKSCSNEILYLTLKVLDSAFHTEESYWNAQCEIATNQNLNVNNIFWNLNISLTEKEV